MADDKKKSPEATGMTSFGTSGALEDATDEIAEKATGQAAVSSEVMAMIQHMQKMQKALGDDELGMPKSPPGIAAIIAGEGAKGFHDYLMDTPGAQAASWGGILGNVSTAVGAFTGIPGLIVGGSRMSTASNQALQRILNPAEDLYNDIYKQALSGKYDLKRQVQADMEAMKRLKLQETGQDKRLDKTGDLQLQLQDKKSASAKELAEFTKDHETEMLGAKEAGMGTRLERGIEADIAKQTLAGEQGMLQEQLRQTSAKELTQMDIEARKEIKGMELEIANRASEADQKRHLTGLRSELYKQAAAQVISLRRKLTPEEAEGFKSRYKAGDGKEEGGQILYDSIMTIEPPKPTPEEELKEGALRNRVDDAVDAARTLTTELEGPEMVAARGLYKINPKAGLEKIQNLVKDQLSLNPDRYTITPEVDKVVKSMVTGEVAPEEAPFVEHLGAESRTPQRMTMANLMGFADEDLFDKANIPKGVVDAAPVLRGVKSSDTYGQVAKKAYENIRVSLKDMEIDGKHYIGAPIASEVATTYGGPSSGFQFVTLKAHRDLSIPRSGAPPIVVKKGEKWAGPRKTWASFGHPDAYATAKKSKRLKQVDIRIINTPKDTKWGKNEMEKALRAAVIEFGQKDYDVSGGGKPGGIHGYEFFTDELINTFLTGLERMRGTEPGLPAEWRR